MTWDRVVLRYVPLQDDEEGFGIEETHDDLHDREVPDPLGLRSIDLRTLEDLQGGGTETSGGGGGTGERGSIAEKRSSTKVNSAEKLGLMRRIQDSLLSGRNTRDLFHVPTPFGQREKQKKSPKRESLQKRRTLRMPSIRGSILPSSKDFSPGVYDNNTIMLV